MSTTYLFPTHFDDDTSDSFSSFGTKSSSLDSMEEPSPHFLQLSEVCDIDALTGQTKKIRKKRCAYDKIDDDKRIQLLEAVQKNGESLKSAAKRLQINYSSAKSILHTFRKEGRILKKSPLECGPRAFSMTNLPTVMEVSPMNAPSYNMPQKFPSQGSIVIERKPPGGYKPKNAGGSPMRGLTSIFANLMLETDDGNEETSILKTLMVEVQKSNEEPVVIPKLNLPTLIPQLQLQPSIENRVEQQELENQPPKIPSLSEITYEPQIDRTLSHPLEVLKQLDNFYMNYSNSPLSGGKGMMLGECSDSGSRKYCPGEFDSFSDMMYAFQKQASTNNNDEVKLDLQVPSILRFNSGLNSQDKSEPKLMKFDSIESTGVLNNMRESPWLLSDTMNKVPFLSSFSQFQRQGISLVNERNK